MQEQTFRLNPVIALGFEDSVLSVGYGSIQHKIEDKKTQAAFLKIMDFCIQPRTSHDIQHFLKTKCDLAPNKTHEVYQLLEEKFLILDSEYLDKNDPFSRDSYFYRLYTKTPVSFQKSLQQKKFTIIGCGGIGANMALILASKGIRHFTLIDKDCVESSNLNRSLVYHKNHIGQQKIEALDIALSNKSERITIKKIDTMIRSQQDANMIGTPDFVIVSGDQKGLVSTVNEYCYPRGIPFINAGYINDIAVWGPLVASNTPCYACFKTSNIDIQEKKDTLQELINNINQHHISPAVAETTLTAASLASLDIIKYFIDEALPGTLGQRHGLWTHDNHIQTQKYQANPDCTLCAV